MGQSQGSRDRSRWLGALLAIAMALIGLHAAPQPADLLTPEERAWLDALAAPLVVGSESNYRPYSYVDEQGNLSGLAGDYLRLLEDRLGVRFEVREYASFAETLEGARKREIDIVPFAIAAQERKGYLDFTAPFLEIRDLILTRAETPGTVDLDGLSGQRVGLIEGYALQAELEAKRPDIEVVPVANELEGVRALSLGNLDALIVDLAVASHHAQEQGITNLRVAGEVDVISAQTFGTRNDWPILNSIIGKGLADIGEAEHEEIYQRWIIVGGVDPGEMERLVKQVAAVVGAVLLIIVATLLWNFSLRRVVARRTLDLEDELQQRRRVEAENARLALAIEHSAEYILVIDKSGQVEFTNRSFENASGREKIEGLPFASLACEASRETLMSALHGVPDSGAWRGRVDLAHAGSGTMRVSMTIAPIRNAAGRIDGYVATCRDITNEERLEARLRHGEKLSALGTLAGGIAHDFNNLLVPILGSIDILRESSAVAAGPELEAISKAGNRARELVQRILIFSRYQEGVKEALDLSEEVEDSITFLRSLLPATIEIESDLCDDLTVNGDRTQIQQILLNLGTNASDAMEHGGGVLRIKSERCSLGETATGPTADLPAGDYCLLSVSDSGIGMDADAKAQIFDPYFTTKPQGKGTGLGLAAVHGIVTAHGGVIDVDSVPGQGTSVRIWLPTVSGKPSTPAAPAPAPERAHGEQIMVVDDDELVLNTVVQMLKMLGYEVSSWASPLDALQALRDAPDTFAAILTDYTMPGLTGAELATKARELRPDIPVIIMTGKVDLLHEFDFDSIPKPMRLGDLGERLREVLSRDQIPYRQSTAENR